MAWLAIGNIRGPQGPVGPPGPAGPPGAQGEGFLTEIRTIVGTTVPAGWLLLNGQTVANANTAFPQFWEVAPASWKVGTNLVLPNGADRVLMGATASAAVGTLTGANSRAIPLSALPVHAHTIAHTHEHPHTHTIAHTHTMAHVHSIAHDHPSGNTSAANVGALNIPLNLVAQFGTGTLGLPQGGAGQPLNLINQPNTDAGGSHAHPFNVAAYTGNSGASSATSTGSASAGSSGQPSDATTGGASTGSSGNAGQGGVFDVTQAALRVNYIVRVAFV